MFYFPGLIVESVSSGIDLVLNDEEDNNQVSEGMLNLFTK